MRSRLVQLALCAAALSFAGCHSFHVDATIEKPDRRPGKNSWKSIIPAPASAPAMSPPEPTSTTAFRSAAAARSRSSTQPQTATRLKSTAPPLPSARRAASASYYYPAATPSFIPASPQRRNRTVSGTRQS